MLPFCQLTFVRKFCTQHSGNTRSHYETVFSETLQSSWGENSHLIILFHPSAVCSWKPRTDPAVAQGMKRDGVRVTWWAHCPGPVCSLLSATTKSWTFLTLCLSASFLFWLLSLDQTLITYSLQQLPITYEIKSKICGLVFTALHILMTTYSSTILRPYPWHVHARASMCPCTCTHTQRELLLWSGHLPTTPPRNYELPTSSNPCCSSEATHPPAWAIGPVWSFCYHMPTKAFPPQSSHNHHCPTLLMKSLFWDMLNWKRTWSKLINWCRNAQQVDADGGLGLNCEGSQRLGAERRSRGTGTKLHNRASVQGKEETSGQEEKTKSRDIIHNRNR